MASQKTIKTWYWIVTILFSILMLYSAFGSFFPNEQTDVVLGILQYPMYILTITAIAKILGVIAILQTKWYVIKEWAYAGFTFDILGAALSFAFAGAGATAALSTLIFIIPMIISYWLWKKL